MSTIVYKLLSADNAQIASTVGNLYAVPSSTTGYIKSIALFNTNATPELVKLWFANNGTGATENQFFEMQLNASASWLIKFGDPLPLVAAAKIRGVTTTASKVNVAIWGREDS